jgi:YVTN family beta-propeller protein
MGGLAPGDVLAGHRIEAVAGQGGMGVVYRATQLALDRTVALKVIAPGLLEDETMRARFVRESKVAASLDHPNVVPVYYAGEDEGLSYIAMRFVPGDDLRGLVRRERRLGPDRAARITAQVGAALDAAHAAGLVHRDVKPANVLIGPGDHVYLTDFGLSKHALSTGGATKAGQWVGTLDYVAPEQIRGERVDARADIYALGCLLFFTLTGRVPFPRESDEAKLWAQLSDPPPRPSAHGAPESFDAVIERALAKAPGDRYPSAGDLGRAALAAAAGEPPSERERLVATGAAAPIEVETRTAQRPAAPSTPTLLAGESRTRVQRGRQPVLVAAALAVAVGIGVATALIVGNRGGDGGAALAPAATSPAASPAAVAAKAPELRVGRSVRVGRRPNVAIAAGDEIFVGSFKESRVAVVAASSGLRRGFISRVGHGVTDAAFGFGLIWLTVARNHQVVALDPRTRQIRHRYAVDGTPGSIATAGGAVWVGIVNRGDVPDVLLALDPGTGATRSSTPYSWGINALAPGGNALWVLARHRARVVRASLRDGTTGPNVAVGHAPSVDAVFGGGALWIATREEDTVTKLVPATGDLVPIGVGRVPQRLTYAGGRIYVANYNSSDLSVIDAKTSRVIGDPVDVPVNPFALTVGGGALWVTSPPNNVITRVVTARGE